MCWKFYRFFGKTNLSQYNLANNGIILSNYISKHYSNNTKNVLHIMYNKYTSLTFRSQTLFLISLSKHFKNGDIKTNRCITLSMHPVSLTSEFMLFPQYGC